MRVFLGYACKLATDKNETKPFLAHKMASIVADAL